MPSSDQNIRDIAVGALPTRLSVLLAGLLTLVVGVGVAIPSEGLSTPFGGDTVKAYPFDPLVNQWHQLREQIQLDVIITASCREAETADCMAAKKLMDVVDDARLHRGRGLIGRLNRSFNLMIKPSAGRWTSALDVLKSGSGDCKNYSIVKYAALLSAGVPATHIRLVIVHNTARKEDHMVASIYNVEKWLLLDNLTMTLVEDIDRKGYVPVYVLDQTGVRRYIRFTEQELSNHTRPR